MAMTTISIKENTAIALQQIAQQTGASLDTLTERAIQQYLRREADRKIREEEESYRLQHEELLTSYDGRFIAMHKGQVIDNDEDELTLLLRVRKQYPHTGILIKKVSSEIDETWHVQTPRFTYQ